MSAPKMRLTPISDVAVRGLSDVRVGYDKSNDYADPLSPVRSNEAAERCMKFKPGHNVHWIQYKAAVRNPLYPIEIQSVGERSFVALHDKKLVTFYTHRPEQIEALLDCYGKGVIGWIHEHWLFESQGHFLCVTTDPSEFEPCSVARQ